MGLFKGFKPILIQALVPENSFEALYVGALRWIAGFDQDVFDAMPLSPCHERPASEFWPVVSSNLYDPDAHLFKVLPSFGSDAYGIGFTLDFKKGWFLTPCKTSEKYPAGAFLLNWAEVNKKTPSFVLSE